MLTSQAAIVVVVGLTQIPADALLIGKPENAIDFYLYVYHKQCATQTIEGHAITQVESRKKSCSHIQLFSLFYRLVKKNKVGGYFYVRLMK